MRAHRQHLRHHRLAVHLKIIAASLAAQNVQHRAFFATLIARLARALTPVFNWAASASSNSSPAYAR